MIIFLIFLFYYLGLSFRYAYILMGVLGAGVLIFVFTKYKIKLTMVMLSIFSIGVLVSFINIDIKREEFSGLIIDSHENYFIFLSKGEKLYTYEKNNDYEIGDYIKIKGYKEKLDFVTLESQFDFKDYLNKKGIYYEVHVNSITRTFKNPIRIKKKRALSIASFDIEEQSLINAILFSKRDQSGDISNMVSLHLSRLISTSGIYIFAYLKFIEFIVNKIRKKKNKTIIPLLLLFPYLIFTFPKFSVIRISFMYLFSLINKNHFTSYQRNALGGLFFLFIDYHFAYDISFILGFFLPIVIGMINEATWKYKGVKKKIIQALFIYLSFIPFELYFYNGINPLSIVLLTILTPIFILGAFSALICFYGIPVYFISNFIFKIISNILSFLSPLSFQFSSPPLSEILILLFIFLFIGFLHYQNINLIPFKRLFGISFSSFLFLYLVPINNLISTEVCFINVGQGDSCLVRKGNTAVMIDTGGLKNIDLAKEVLIPFFQKKRIYDIDLVITTHQDFDHYGAYDSLKENFYVKSLITDSTLFPIKVGGISFYNYNNHIDSFSEENDKSLVVGFTLSNVSYLVTGDAPMEVEKSMMREYESIPCDILKVGHHGSNTSTCDEFIEYLNPIEAVISCGKNNRYGHPTDRVLNTLKRHGVRIRRTDLEGTISYYRYIFM